ncbi:DnaD domain-containing protein [Bacillus sp. PS06]|uniref:DnaD domain-containing protein n=1 Tax=Bacillus sp. PS06 TaxID=2764176 RepID=UPI0017840115|nr:DnaD domain protein [Bacillus sp. PS06]MBD8068791.1 DnaD domain protein [Bacillus sp. PS06]
MAKYRMVRTDFWKNPIVSEEMTPEDKYFFLYLLTNPHTTQIGIYKITKKQMAFDTGYSIETIHALMDRMIRHHQMIRYNPETREIAIKNWGKYNLHKGGKPVMDCIFSELKEVEDTSLIEYVAAHIMKGDIQALFKSFFKIDAEDFEDISALDDSPSYIDEATNDTLTTRNTISGQKEKEKQKENKKQQQKESVSEIIEFWDQNGFGYSNVNGKEQLLSWLDDSKFLNPKDVIMKALQIACMNNKRKLNYVIGILRNWENESLLTVEEIDLSNNKNPVTSNRNLSRDEMYLQNSK